MKSSRCWTSNNFRLILAESSLLLLLHLWLSLFFFLLFLLVFFFLLFLGILIYSELLEVGFFVKLLFVVLFFLLLILWRPQALLLQVCYALLLSHFLSVSHHLVQSLLSTFGLFLRVLLRTSLCSLPVDIPLVPSGHLNY